jgi:hypothetical protein
MELDELVSFVAALQGIRRRTEESDSEADDEGRRNELADPRHPG